MDSTCSDGGFGLGERVRGPLGEWRTRKGSGHGCSQKSAVDRRNKDTGKYKQCRAIYNSYPTSDDW